MKIFGFIFLALSSYCLRAHPQNDVFEESRWFPANYYATRGMFLEPGAADTTVSYSDALYRSRRVTFMDGSSVEADYDCCGLTLFRDRDETVTEYFYDDVKRLITAIRAGVTYGNVFAQNLLMQVRAGIDGTVKTRRIMQFDFLGHLRDVYVPGRDHTTYQEMYNAGTGLTVRQTTFPNKAILNETFNGDGLLMRVDGSAAAESARYDYGVEAAYQTGPGVWIWSPYVKFIALTSGGADTSEWSKIYTDAVGRTYRRVGAAASGQPNPAEQIYFNLAGQITKYADADGVTRLWQYDAKGQVEYAAQDLDQNGQIDFGGTDRIWRIVREVVTNHGATVKRSRFYCYNQDNATNTTLLLTRELAADGNTWWDTDLRGLRTVALAFPGSGVSRVTEIKPDQTQSLRQYQFGQIYLARRLDSGNAELGRTDYGYDAHRRMNVIHDARNGAMQGDYTDLDELNKMTSPIPGVGQAAQVPQAHYNKMGWIDQVTENDSGVNHEYLDNDRLW